MSKWTADAVGEFRREEQPDGTILFWLAGWDLTDGEQRITTLDPEDGSPHLVLRPGEDEDEVLIAGWTLAEMKDASGGADR